MKACFLICVLAAPIAQPVVATEREHNLVSPIDVATDLRECLVEMDIGRGWDECVQFYSYLCEAVRSDFYRCYSTEGKAWQLLITEEFAMTFALVAVLDKSEASIDYSRRVQLLCSAQSTWASFALLECSFQSSRAGVGSIRKVYRTRCSQKLNAERAISLRRDRSLPTGTTDFEAFRPYAGSNEADVRSTVGMWCDAESGKME
jgi:hypothetical protein